MQKPGHLLRTKYRLPFIRPDLVLRMRLQQRIEQGLRGPLTVVIAPAGFGKTTLAVSGIANAKYPVAWLSLDRNDNQMGNFLSYLIVSLQEADPTIGNEAFHLLTPELQTPAKAILSSLINDLETSRNALILVLDDYQFINALEVHEIVGFLLEHCPHTLHILIVSRSDPPLPLARMRVRGLMAELRTTDLRFTADEAAQFLNGMMGLHLDPGSVALLEERTEGWIAGLQMAALSMRDRKDIAGFIKGFSGTNRFILDYLLEEVLASQPPEIQHFLACTSILDRLSASLCDALLSRDGIPETGEKSKSHSEQSSDHSSASYLSYLERANLFLVPLDDERIWFRYHHLFGDLLRARLSSSTIAEERVLHMRAAVWFEQHGNIEDAIHHALIAQDFQQAARLIETQAEAVWLRAEYARLIEWIHALPLDLVHGRPWLCIWCAWSYTQIGSLADASAWIEAADRATHKLNPDQIAVSSLPTERGTLEYEIATLRALTACLAQDYDRAIRLAGWVLDHPLHQDKKAALAARCHVLHSLSSMYYVVGELGLAEESAVEAITASKEVGFDLRHIHAANKLALVYITRGQLHHAFQFVQETLAYFDAKGLARYAVTHLLRCRWLDLLYEWNRIDEIDRVIDEYELSATSLTVPYVCVDLLNLQARQLMAKNDLAGAQHALDQVGRIVRTSYIWPAMTRQTESLQVKLWLRTENLQQARSWMELPLEKDSDRFPFLSESRLIGRVRVLIALHQYEEALNWIDQLETSAISGGRQGSLVELHLVKALALQQLGRILEALKALEPALGMAEVEGYCRTLIDEGPAMATLLTQAIAVAPSQHQQVALRLLAERKWSETAQESLTRSSFIAGRAVTQSVNLIEALSQREIEVLDLMAQGQTNQAIARQLVVATGTVKAHAASIYRKLDVSNRTEAVSRARQLGILP